MVRFEESFSCPFCKTLHSVTSTTGLVLLFESVDKAVACGLDQNVCKKSPCSPINRFLRYRQ